jgi:hypothetical protein
MVMRLKLLDDESKNQQTSCPGKLWECGFITAMVIFALCFLEDGGNLVTVAEKVTGAVGTNDDKSKNQQLNSTRYPLQNKIHCK